MCHKVGNTLLADFDTLDLAELVFGLLGGNFVGLESALGIVEKTEDLVGLLNLNDICITRTLVLLRITTPRK